MPRFNAEKRSMSWIFPKFPGGILLALKSAREQAPRQRRLGKQIYDENVYELRKKATEVNGLEDL
jgi:hypothetical protein